MAACSAAAAAMHFPKQKRRACRMSCVQLWMLRSPDQCTGRRAPLARTRPAALSGRCRAEQGTQRPAWLVSATEASIAEQQLGPTVSGDGWTARLPCAFQAAATAASTSCRLRHTSASKCVPALCRHPLQLHAHRCAKKTPRLRNGWAGQPVSRSIRSTSSASIVWQPNCRW